MADSKTYTEDEHLGILQERVRRETAELTEKNGELADSNTELQNKLDVETSAKQAAETERDNVRTEFDAFKQKVEDDKAAEGRKESRVAELREAASHLDDKFFEDEGRVARIVAMDDEQFAGYKADMAVGSTGGGQTPPPRQTAMAGKQVAGEGATTSTAGRDFMLRGRVVTAETKED